MPLGLTAEWRENDLLKGGRSRGKAYRVGFHSGTRVLMASPLLRGHEQTFAGRTHPPTPEVPTGIPAQAFRHAPPPPKRPPPYPPPPLTPLPFREPRGGVVLYVQPLHMGPGHPLFTTYCSLAVSTTTLIGYVFPGHEHMLVLVVWLLATACSEHWVTPSASSAAGQRSGSGEGLHGISADPSVDLEGRQHTQPWHASRDHRVLNSGPAQNPRPQDHRQQQVSDGGVCRPLFVSSRAGDLRPPFSLSRVEDSRGGYQWAGLVVIPSDPHRSPRRSIHRQSFALYKCKHHSGAALGCGDPRYEWCRCP